jgi:SSS family solute:Na+ symporter
MVQAFFLIGGATLLTIIGLNAVGGWSGLQEKLPESYFSFINPVSDPDFPWTGIIFGAPILAIWYWCTDNYIVQRILSAKDLNAARSGSIFAGFLKILPVFILVVPGLIAAVLFPGIKGEEAYPTLVASTLLPVGIKGIVIAGFLSALMSSLASTFNSTATVFALDFYGHFYPNASERKLVLIGRLTTTILVVTGILWIPFTKVINTHLYVYLQSVQAYISPPIVAVFLFGIFWKGANAKAAIWSLIVGGMLGSLRMILEILEPNFVYDNFLLSLFIEMNFLHFAIFLFFVCSITIIGVSIFQKIAINDKIQQLIFKWNYVFKTHIVNEDVYQCENINRVNWIFSATLLIILMGLFTGFLNR